MNALQGLVYRFCVEGRICTRCHARRPTRGRLICRRCSRLHALSNRRYRAARRVGASL